MGKARRAALGQGGTSKPALMSRRGAKVNAGGVRSRLCIPAGRCEPRGVNTSSDPAFAAIQLMIMFGVVLWWAYVAGIVFAAVVVVRSRTWLRATAWWSLRAQIAPLAALLVLALICILQLALDRALISEGAGAALVMTSLAAGPILSLWLIGALLVSRLRAAPAMPST